MKQFEDAKTCLREAWTFSKVDPSIKKLVEHHLKMMKIVCDSVTEITKSDSESFQSHLPFEKVADALVKFRGNRIEKKRVFKIALEYYEKAFARANAVSYHATLLSRFSSSDSHSVVRKNVPQDSLSQRASRWQEHGSAKFKIAKNNRSKQNPNSLSVQCCSVVISEINTLQL